MQPTMSQFQNQAASREKPLASKQDGAREHARRTPHAHTLAGSDSGGLGVVALPRFAGAGRTWRRPCPAPGQPGKKMEQFHRQFLPRAGAERRERLAGEGKGGAACPGRRRQRREQKRLGDGEKPRARESLGQHSAQSPARRCRVRHLEILLPLAPEAQPLRPDAVAGGDGERRRVQRQQCLVPFQGKVRVPPEEGADPPAGLQPKRLRQPRHVRPSGQIRAAYPTRRQPTPQQTDPRDFNHGRGAS